MVVAKAVYDVFVSVPNVEEEILPEISAALIVELDRWHRVGGIEVPAKNSSVNFVGKRISEEEQVNSIYSGFGGQ